MSFNVIIFVIALLVAQEGLARAHENGERLTDVLKNFSESNTKSDAAIECFKSQSTNFNNFADHLTILANSTKKKLAVGAEEARITALMQKIGDSFTKLPKDVWTKIQEQKYSEALEKAKEIAKTINTAASRIVALLYKNNKNMSEKAVEEFNNINVQSNNKNKKMTSEIMLCMSKRNQI